MSLQYYGSEYQNNLADFYKLAHVVHFYKRTIFISSNPFESGTLDRIRTTEKIKTELPNFYDHKTDSDDRIWLKDQINTSHIWSNGPIWFYGFLFIRSFSQTFSLLVFY